MEVSLLELSDFQEEDFTLFAIRSSLEDYKLAYLLNQELGVQLHKKVPDLDFRIEKQDLSFSFFEFIDEEQQDEQWNLILNHIQKTIQSTVGEGLFSSTETSVTKRFYLQKELKQFDYLLKSNQVKSTEQINKILKTINSIKGVSTAIEVDLSMLKNTAYLIF